MPARDDEPVVLAERGDGAQQAVALLGREQLGLGRRGRAARGTFVGDPERKVLAPAGGAAPVPGLVDDDLEQPRPERRAAAKAAEGRIGLHERVLGRFLGVGGRARDEIGGPECDLLMQHDERLVGRGVATLRLLDELRLCEWSAHHLVWIHRGGTEGSRTTPRLHRARSPGLDLTRAPARAGIGSWKPPPPGSRSTTRRCATARRPRASRSPLDDKLAIAHRLDELGFDYVEGGWPGLEPEGRGSSSRPWPSSRWRTPG